MKKLLIFFLLIIATYAEGQYNIGFSGVEMSDNNDIAIISLGSGGEAYIDSGYFAIYGESGFLLMTTNDLYTNDGVYYGKKADVFTDIGLYLEGGLMLRKKEKAKIKPYGYVGIKGTYLVSRLFNGQEIPGVEDFLSSGKLGGGIEFESGFFIEYNYEVYKNTYSNYSKDNKLYANSIRFGARY